VGLKYCLYVIYYKNRSDYSKNRSYLNEFYFIGYMKPEEKIFLAYYESRKVELYFNELKDLAMLSDSSLAHNLKKLVSQRMLSVNKTRSNTFYKVENKRIFALEFSKIAVLKFLDLNRGVRIPIQNFLDNISLGIYSIVLFGSASKKMERKGSDIDLLIITDIKQDFEAIKKEVENISNYPLNIFICSTQEFIKGDDHIIIQAKKTGFPIKGEQNYYEVLLDEYK